jgi:hypothetical protein
MPWHHELRPLNTSCWLRPKISLGESTPVVYFLSIRVGDWFLLACPLRPENKGLSLAIGATCQNGRRVASRSTGPGRDVVQETRFEFCAPVQPSRRVVSYHVVHRRLEKSSTP